jgi:alpha-L-rhamnosidase
MALLMLAAAQIYLAAASGAVGVQEGNTVHSAPTRLRVEGLEQQQQSDGLVVLSEKLPRFAFIAHSLLMTRSAGVSAPRGLAQAAYHIRVLNRSGVPVWDSGVVKSANCSEIAYAGELLRAFEAYTWRVKWLGSDGRWSAEASAAFEMGPLDEADWAAADWLGGSQLRTEFKLPSVPVRARAYMAAAGCGCLEINSARPLPDTRGVCAWTVFEKRAHYQTYDITQLLRKGANAVGILSNQIDARRKHLVPSPMARAMLRIELGGGRAPVLVATTGGGGGSGDWMQTKSWTTMAGNGRDWHMHMNWTAVEEGWSSPGFSSSMWSTAVSIPSPTTVMSAQQMPAATGMQRVHPMNATQIASNSTHTIWLYDFGHNMVGTIELQPLPDAAPGSQLLLTHGEWLESWQSNQSAQRCDPTTCSNFPGESIVPVVSGGLQTVLHTLRADCTRPLAPIFAWHGFQFVTIVAERRSSFSGGMESISAQWIHPNVTATGKLTFGGNGIAGSESESSAEVFRGVQRMLLASQLSNLAACGCIP